MAKIQFLTILVTVTCFLGGVVSVTDKELVERFKYIDDKLQQLQEENKDQSVTMEKLKEENLIMRKEIERQNILIRQLFQTKNEMRKGTEPDFVEELLQNTTIEERVALLEVQVVEIQEDVTELDEDFTGLDQDVNFLFDETVIQDERIYNLEQTTIVIDEAVEDLQVTTTTLDFRVTILEENGGGDGNSSVAELEVRVETLESDVAALDETVVDQETRLTTAEENIQGLQMTDVELDERVTALEENGGGNEQNETIVFTAVLTSYSTIPYGSAVEFNEVLLNEGDGYDSTTGTFTVPPGGDGFYYFSAYFVVYYLEYGYFDIQINGETICTALGETETSTFTDSDHTSCTAATYATEGDTVQVVYRSGTDTTPVFESTSWYYNGFNGFRI